MVGVDTTQTMSQRAEGWLARFYRRTLGKDSSNVGVVERKTKSKTKTKSSLADKIVQQRNDALKELHEQQKIERNRILRSSEGKSLELFNLEIQRQEALARLRDLERSITPRRRKAVAGDDDGTKDGLDVECTSKRQRRELEEKIEIVSSGRLSSSVLSSGSDEERAAGSGPNKLLMKVIQRKAEVGAAKEGNVETTSTAEVSGKLQPVTTEITPHKDKVEEPKPKEREAEIQIVTVGEVQREPVKETETVSGEKGGNGTIGGEKHGDIQKNNEIQNEREKEKEKDDTGLNEKANNRGNALLAEVIRTKFKKAAEEGQSKSSKKYSDITLEAFENQYEIDEWRKRRLDAK